MPCVFPLLLLNYLLIYLLSSALCFFQRQEQANFHLLKGCLTRLLLCCVEPGWSKSRTWAHFSSRSSDLKPSNSFNWFCTHLCWGDLKIRVNLLMTNPLLPQNYFKGQLHVLFCLHRQRLFSLFVLLFQGNWTFPFQGLKPPSCKALSCIQEFSSWRILPSFHCRSSCHSGHTACCFVCLCSPSIWSWGNLNGLASLAGGISNNESEMSSQ